MRIFVGYAKHFRGVLRSDSIPTEETHGHLYKYVTGPFKTVRGAKAMVHYGENNPHCQTVADAERLGRKYADILDSLLDYVMNKLYD